MPNAFEEMDSIGSEALVHLEDGLNITKLAAKDISSDFNKTADGYAKGSTVRIVTRPEYEAKEFSTAIEPQESRESKRSLTVEKLFDISVEITAKEKAMNLSSLSEQVIKPAAYKLAEACDIYVGSKIVEGAGNYYSNDIFASAADMALARDAANIQQLELDGRFCLVNTALEAKLLGLTYFNTFTNRGEDGARVFREGNMGRGLGMDFYSSVNFPVDGHTPGDGSTTVDSGTPVSGIYPNNKIGDTSLVVDSTSGTFNAGDRIKVAGLKRPLIVASQVVATGTAIPLVDPITEVITDGAAVTVVGSGLTVSTLDGAIFDSQSLAIAMPVLDKPSDKPASVVSNNGYSIRVAMGYDMNTKKETLSLDLLIGAKAYDPRRITLLRNY